MHKRSRLLASLLVVGAVGGSAVSVATASTAHKSKAGKPFNVTLLASITGAQASEYVGCIAGVRATIDDINSKGGANGHKIALNVLDNQSSTTITPAVAQKAISGKPTAIIECTGTSFFALDEPYYETAKIPVFESAQQSSFFPWLYSNQPTQSQAIATVGTMMTAVVGAKKLRGLKVALVGSDTPGVVAEEPGIAKVLSKLGAKLVTSQLNPLGSPSFSSGAANVVSSGADAVMLEDTPADGVVEAKALLAGGFKGPIVSNFGATSVTTLQTIDSPQFYSQLLFKIPTSSDLAAKVAKKFGFGADTSAANFGQGWGLAWAMDAGLAACGYPCSSSKLEAAENGLGTITIPGSLDFAPYVVAKKDHTLIDHYGVVKWSNAKKAMVQFGNPVPEGPPTYLPLAKS